jgi:hypothetical protein
VAAAAGFIVAPNLVYRVVAPKKDLLIDIFTPRREGFIS